MNIIFGILAALGVFGGLFIFLTEDNPTIPLWGFVATLIFLTLGIVSTAGIL